MVGDRRDTVVQGPDKVPRDQWPAVTGVHWAFDLMVGVGFFLLGLGLWLLLAWWRTRRTGGELLDRRGSRLLLAPGSALPGRRRARPSAAGPSSRPLTGAAHFRRAFRAACGMSPGESRHSGEPWSHICGNSGGSVLRTPTSCSRAHGFGVRGVAREPGRDTGGPSPSRSSPGWRGAADGLGEGRVSRTLRPREQRWSASGRRSNG
ncbi:cytochrome ubiquinol oxidase subunit I [Streptomyces sp. NPDC005476]|uniref:cytochrome ubiquinol oxidase subunit I n=1 Tax=Streptomyces sp. NPDC005476 TaxID=3156882 RepID=UPI003451752B